MSTDNTTSYLWRYTVFKACPSFKELPAELAADALAHWGPHILFKQAVDSSIIIGDADLAAANDLDFNKANYLNQLMPAASWTCPTGASNALGTVTIPK